MPELPEVETLRRGIEPLVLGKEIVSVQARPGRSFRDVASLDVFTETLTGSKVSRVRRHGKYLLLDLVERNQSSGHWVLVMHMGMSGQLRSGAPSALQVSTAKHAHFTMEFEDGIELAFIDPRTFGRVYIDRAESFGANLPSLDHLGPDALSSADPFQRLRLRCAKSSIKIKQMLLDQSLIAGIGNMYGDEILFDAGVHPCRVGSSLDLHDLNAIGRSTKSVLTQAIELGGSSLADLSYRDVNGDLGKYQAMHRAYGRAHMPCWNCATEIQRVKFGGRSSFFCSNCQV